MFRKSLLSLAIVFSSLTGYTNAFDKEKLYTLLIAASGIGMTYFGIKANILLYKSELFVPRNNIGQHTQKISKKHKNKLSKEDKELLINSGCAMFFGFTMAGFSLLDLLSQIRSF